MSSFSLSGGYPPLPDFSAMSGLIDPSLAIPPISDIPSNTEINYEDIPPPTQSKKKKKSNTFNWVTPGMIVWLVFAFLIIIISIFTVGCGFCSTCDFYGQSSFNFFISND